MCYCLIFFVYSFPASSNNPDFLIDDEINLEEILSDVPDNLNLEKITASQLSRMPYFDAESSQIFIKFRNNNGSEWRECLSSSGIPGLTPLQNFILDYLSENKAVKSKDVFFNASLRSGAGFKPGDESIGDSRYYMRFKGTINDYFKLNVLTERDKSEPRALDLFSASAALKFPEYRTELLIGDYRPNYGQGLLFGRYSSFYPDGTGVMNTDSGNYMNGSFEESRFLRGFMFKKEVDSFDFMLWYSSRKHDASLDNEGNAISLDYTGYHFSGDGRNELSEKIYGSRISYNLRDKLSLGISGVYTGYNPEFSAPEDERHVNYRSGGIFRYVSLDGCFKMKPFKIFFEKAACLDGGDAFIAGAEIAAGISKAAFSFRDYDRKYYSPRQGALSVLGENSGEKGFYTSFETPLLKKIILSSSIDIANAVSRSYTSEMPPEKRRLSISLKSGFKNAINWSLMSKTSSDSDNNGGRKSARLRFDGGWGKVYKWRADGAWSYGGGKSGPYMETGFVYKKGIINTDVSVGAFDIPSYDARYYRYERDVPGRGYSSAVWGKGLVCTAVLRIGVASFRLRYESTDEGGDISEAALQLDSVF